MPKMDPRAGSPPVETEWGEWHQHPVTVAFLRLLALERERLQELLADGAVASGEELAFVIGKCRLYKQLMEMEYAEFYANYTGESEDEGLKPPAGVSEPFGPTAGRPRGSPRTL